MLLNRYRCGLNIHGRHRSFPKNPHRGFYRYLKCQSSNTESSGAKDVRPNGIERSLQGIQSVDTIVKSDHSSLIYPRHDYQPVKSSPYAELSHKDKYNLDPHSMIDQNATIHRAYIALGSNVGDRISMIELACREMDRRHIKVLRTSALYESAPMYLEDQGHFINGACEVETKLLPLALLDTLKAIEVALGRQKSIKNGPRRIDLDILLYDNLTVDHETLSIPHPRISEREFVLRPLCDLIPQASLPPPLLGPDFNAILQKFAASNKNSLPLTPLSPNLDPVSPLHVSRPTKIMGILNLTPDSFSDGGVYPTEPSLLLPTLNAFLLAGVSILDIGGQSTRPRAPQVTAAEELSRVLPTIKFIRSQPAFDKLAISIDTYRASVAHAAISAGANIVNDVSAGQMDPNMLPTVAHLGCSIILMHMRGTPETMTSLTDYSTSHHGDVVHGVVSELLLRVADAEKAGIRRWRILLDPGIGFAKNKCQSLSLLRQGKMSSADLRSFPWVVGASRKGFIGDILGIKDPRKRIWGTAAAVTAAIQSGADVVRVHDVVEMSQVIRMADAIYRPRSN